MIRDLFNAVLWMLIGAILWRILPRSIRRMCIRTAYWCVDSFRENTEQSAADWAEARTDRAAHQPFSSRN